MLTFLISILSIVFIISIPIFLHELGHFLAARSVGIKVEKFYVGMNLFGLGISKKINETEYGIGFFPLGGYVKVAGIIDESLDSDQEDIKKDYEFRSKNTFQKLWFLSAGVIMNFILSIFIFTCLTFSFGIMEPSDDTIIESIHNNIIIFNESNDTTSVISPASILGLKKGDQILSVDGYKINNWLDISDNISNKADSVISITWLTQNNIKKKDSVKLVGRPIFNKYKIEKHGVLGIVGKTVSKKINLFESINIAVLRTYDIISSSFYGVIGIITGNIPLKYMSGIVGIAKEAGSVATAEYGFINLLFLMAFISSNLGLINILPIPGLDGGHAAIAIVEGLIGRELSINIKYAIQFVGLVFILSLFIFTIFNDISNIFN